MKYFFTPMHCKLQLDLFGNVLTVIILMIACSRMENSLLGLPKCKYYQALSTQLMNKISRKRGGFKSRKKGQFTNKKQSMNDHYRLYISPAVQKVPANDKITTSDQNTV